jgi:ribosome-binding protein aMBF1 (putative translation factor)
MIKYWADLYFRRVVRVEVDRETAHFVWSKGEKQAKRSEFHVYKDTWEEAHAELVKYVNWEIAKARTSLEWSQDKLKEVMELKEEE